MIDDVIILFRLFLPQLVHSTSNSCHRITGTRLSFFSFVRNIPNKKKKKKRSERMCFFGIFLLMTSSIRKHAPSFPFSSLSHRWSSSLLLSFSPFSVPICLLNARKTRGTEIPTNRRARAAAMISDRSVSTPSFDTPLTGTTAK